MAEDVARKIADSICKCEHRGGDHDPLDGCEHCECKAFQYPEI